MSEKSDGDLSEDDAWRKLTPEERVSRYPEMLEIFLAEGGSLAPEHDSQSPFDFPEYYQDAEPLVLREKKPAFGTAPGKSAPKTGEK